MQWNKIWQTAFAVLALLVAATASADDHKVKNKVVEPGEEFFGTSYNQLANEWTNWVIREPFATNPITDPDGRFCDRNQHGKVWFLASTFEGIVDRTCEVPAGKALFLSLGGAFVSFAPEFPSAGDPCLQMATALERVRCDVNNDIPVAPGLTLEATLDGAPIEDLLAFRTQSAPRGFTLRIANSSMLTDLGIAPGNRTTAVADGYFLFLKPLKPGTHTLNLRMVKPDQTEAGVNYTLIIEDEDGDH